MYYVHLVNEAKKGDGMVFRCHPEASVNLISRDRELLGMQWAYKAGCGVPVYAVFKNGFAMGYAPGRQVTFEDFMKPPVNRYNNLLIDYKMTFIVL